MVEADETKIAAFFARSALGLRVYEKVAAVVDDLRPATVQATKSQVAFRRRLGFCWIWLPGRHLARPKAEVVLSCRLDRPDADPRWKQVVQVTRARWMHLLEVHSPYDVDAQVAGWIAEAWALVG